MKDDFCHPRGILHEDIPQIGFMGANTNRLPWCTKSIEWRWTVLLLSHSLKVATSASSISNEDRSEIEMVTCLRSTRTC
jgi:hypothetical protein